MQARKPLFPSHDGFHVPWPCAILPTASSTPSTMRVGCTPKARPSPSTQALLRPAATAPTASEGFEVTSRTDPRCSSLPHILTHRSYACRSGLNVWRASTLITLEAGSSCALARESTGNDRSGDVSMASAPREKMHGSSDGVLAKQEQGCVRVRERLEAAVRVHDALFVGGRELQAGLSGGLSKRRSRQVTERSIQAF